MLLETSQRELTAHHHELGDAELSNLQLADFCLALAKDEQLTFTSDEVDIYNDGQTDESAASDSLDTAVSNEVPEQVDSVTSEPCDEDICHTPLACASNRVVEDRLGVNNFGQFDDSQSSCETSQDQACHESSHAQEMTVAVKQWKDDTDDAIQLDICPKLIKEADCNYVQTGLSESLGIDNDRDGPHSSNREGVIIHHIFGDECGDTCDSITDDISSAEVETSANEEAEVDLMWHTSTVSLTGEAEQTSDYVIKDTEDKYMSYPLDCENSRFMDMHVQSRVQRDKLTLDSSEMETIRSEEDQMSSLFSCISGTVEKVSKEFPTAVEFHQNSDLLKADIYASFGGMELRDDMELIPVQDENAGAVCNREDTKTVCDRNSCVDNMTKFTGLSNDSEVLNTGMFAFLDGMALRDDMELIPVDDVKSGTVHNTEGPKTASVIYSYSDTMKNVASYSNDFDIQAYGDENERLELTSETVPRDNSGLEDTRQIIGDSNALDVVANYGELGQPSDSGIRLPTGPEHASVSDDETSLYTSTAHDLDHDELQQDLVLTHTEDVTDNNDNSEPADTEDETGRTSAAPISATGSVKSAAELQTVDMLVPLETTADTGVTDTVVDSAVSSNAPEIVDSYLSSTEQPEVVKNAEHEYTTGCASSVYTTRSLGADLYTTAGLNKNSIMEPNEEASSTVFYASEDIPFPAYEESDKQLELFTADNLSTKTQRLELDDLTLTVTCFIPEDNEELVLDDDIHVLDDVKEGEYVEEAAASSANDPAKSSGKNMDNNVISTDKTLPRRRSSEFMLPYLMPIDETAEFTDDSSADSNDRVPEKSRSLQQVDSLIDMETEPSNNAAEKMDCNINASPTVERAYHLCHELSGKSLHDNAAVTSVTAEPGLGSSASNVNDPAGTTDGCKTELSDDKERIICEDSLSFVEDTVDRNDDDVSETISPVLWFRPNHQDSVGPEVGMINKQRNEGSAVAASADVTQVDYLLDDTIEHITTPEHASVAVNVISQARSKEYATSRDDALMLFAANATEQSSSAHADVRTAESSVSSLVDEDEHFLDKNAFNDNKLQGISGTTEHTEYKGQNSENIMTVDLDRDIFSSAGATLDSNSAVTHSAELQFSSEPRKHGAEAAVQLCERPVLQSSGIRAIIGDIMNGLQRARGTAGDKRQTADEERRLSETDTNDVAASHSFASAVSSRSPVEVETPTETEEPATDALTDFESTLEQLHSPENAASPE